MYHILIEKIKFNLILNYQISYLLVVLQTRSGNHAKYKLYMRV